MFHFLNNNPTKKTVIPAEAGIQFKKIILDLFLVSLSLSLFFLLLSLSNPAQIGYSLAYKIFGISSITSLILMFRHQLLHFLKTDLNPQTKTILGDLSLVSLIIFAIFSWINHANPVYTQPTETLTSPQTLQSTIKLIPGIFFILLLSLASLLLFLKDKIRRNLDEFLKYGFLISLLTVTLGSLDFEFIQTTPILNNIVTFLKTYTLLNSIILIIIGTVTFYKLPQKKTSTNTKINYIPILLLIIIVFTLIKAPYLEKDFTGKHHTKYNAYVEPAMHMVKEKNLFLNKRKYVVDPINNPNGDLEKFGQLPALEFLLATSYAILPFLKIELATRIVTHLIGILILILLFLFLKKWLKTNQSLWAVFLLSINPLFIFSTFVTVYDSLLILITLITLFFISNFIQTNSFKNIFLSSFFIGLGLICKYSILIWLLPITFLILLFNSKKLTETIKLTLLIILIVIFILLGFRYTIVDLPTKVFSLGSVFYLTLFWSFFLCTLFFMSKNIYTFLFKKIKFQRIGNVLSTLFLFINFIIFIFIIFSKKFQSFGNFLTDSRLIFDIKLYYNLLISQQIEYLTISLFLIGLIGLITTFIFSKNKLKTNLIPISFFLGTFVYFILASKSIFFHEYYSLILSLSFSISASIFIVKITENIKNKKAYIFYIFIFLLAILPSVIKKNHENLNRSNDDIFLASEYLIKNTEENDLFIDDNGKVPTLSIYTERGRAWKSFLNTDTFRNLVKEKGFGAAMEKYKIKYLVTTMSEPNYILYVDAFIKDETLSSSSYLDRGQLIINQLHSNSKDQFSAEEMSKRLELVDKFKIKNKFLLEKQVGSYNFYKFKD